MDSRKRILGALRREIPDRVPTFELLIDEESIIKLAGSSNLIMSPEDFKKYIKPYLIRIVEHAHKKGLMIIKHSDGNIWPILDDLVDTGFDGIHPNN